MNNISGGNYWLNLITLEELLDELYNYLVPIKYKEFVSENHIRVYIKTIFSKFFETTSNKKHAKYENYINLEFLIIPIKNGSEVVYKVDSFALRAS